MKKREDRSDVSGDCFFLDPETFFAECLQKAKRGKFLHDIYLLYIGSMIHKNMK